MFDPPIFPSGPGCTDGDMNNDLMPLTPLKQINVTTVSIDSPMFSKVDSKSLEPSFICIINRLNKSSIPIPKFFFKGDARIVMNAYIVKTNMRQATTDFKIMFIISGVENTDGSLHRNINNTSIVKTKIGCINPMIADLENPICVVLHNTNVLKP